MQRLNSTFQVQGLDRCLLSPDLALLGPCKMFRPCNMLHLALLMAAIPCVGAKNDLDQIYLVSNSSISLIGKLVMTVHARK